MVRRPVARSLAAMGSALVGSVVLASCSAGITGPDPDHVSSAVTTTTATTTSTQATTTSTPTTGTLTSRQGWMVPSPQPEAGAPTRVILDSVSLASRGHLAIAFHPDSGTTVRSSSSGLEACPASLSGTMAGSSWPSWAHFEDCEPLDADGTELPSLGGMFHIAFAVRATRDVDTARVIVEYVPADPYFEVLPARGGAVNIEVISQAKQPR